MAENKTDAKKEETKASVPAPDKKNLPQLGALEDDDEFEVSVRERTELTGRSSRLLVSVCGCHQVQKPVTWGGEAVMLRGSDREGSWYRQTRSERED